MDKSIIFSLLIILFFAGGYKNMSAKDLTFEIIVNADIETVYNSWTSNEGIKTFLHPIVM